MNPDPMQSRPPAAGSAFGPEARLRNRRMIDLVKARGASHVGRCCVVVVLDTPPDGQRRAAFLITRRFSPLAVTRNRARRLFRETFRILFPHLAPCWLLLIPRRRIQTAKMPDVLAEARRALQKSGLCGPAAD